MEFNWTSIIIAVIAAGPGLLALIGQRRKDKRDDEASSIENAGKVTAQALTLIQPLNTRITELEQQVIKLREEAIDRDKKIEEQNDKIEQQDDIIRKQNIRLEKNDKQIKELLAGIKKLIDQIIRLGHVPDWKPEGD